MLKDRLKTQIKRYLGGAAQHLFIATSLTDSATYPRLAMQIGMCYLLSKGIQTTRFKKTAQISSLRRIIVPCFGKAGNIGGQIVHIDKRHHTKLDDSEFQQLHCVWPRGPWSLVYLVNYYSAGAAAGRAAKDVKSHSICAHVRISAHFVQYNSSLPDCRIFAGRAPQSRSTSALSVPHGQGDMESLSGFRGTRAVTVRDGACAADAGPCAADVGAVAGGRWSVAQSSNQCCFRDDGLRPQRRSTLPPGRRLPPSWSPAGSLRRRSVLLTRITRCPPSAVPPLRSPEHAMPPGAVRLRKQEQSCCRRSRRHGLRRPRQ